MRSLLAPASRALLGKKMELYAGMVENMDHHIGRLIDHLKKIGEYENTIFVVFGDNGAEGTDLFQMIAGTPGTRDFLFAAINWSQTHPNAWGDPGSYVGYGPMWAQVSMTPFSQYKGWLAEGGIRNALIVSGPGRPAAPGSINHGVMHVADLMPTLLEVAGAAYPKTLAGRELPPLMGKSWGAVLAGKADSPRTEQDYLAWEVFGNRAVRQGDWKLRWQYKPYGKEDWELFDLADPAERKDSPQSSPDKVKELVALWDGYVAGQQRGAAEPLAVRDAGRPMPQRQRTTGLPAAGLQAAVRAAQGHAGRAQALITAGPDESPLHKDITHEQRQDTQEAGRRPAPDRHSGARPRRALPAAGLGPGAGALLLEGTLSDSNAVPLIFQSISGNSNPFDPALTVTPGAKIDATMAMTGYAHTFTLADRSAMAAILLPMGRLSGEVTAAGKTFNESTSGFGDPMLEFTVNLLGPKAQKAFPTCCVTSRGSRLTCSPTWRCRSASTTAASPEPGAEPLVWAPGHAPIVWQLGEWVPGRRTTLEFLPAVWLFGDNNNYVGQTLKTDPMFQLDAHLTRDFTEQLLGLARRSPGTTAARPASTASPGEAQQRGRRDFTLGYQVNDNLGSPSATSQP
jgi:hypothetical protein